MKRKKKKGVPKFQLKQLPIGAVGECYGRWIYIRNLLSRFNVDLLAHCSDYPIYCNFCPYITNHGLGSRTFNGSHCWYRTHPHMLELIFHRRMLEDPWLTASPAFADAVFLAYYSSVIFPMS
ncbi:hypothetical protein AAC387_Pa12g1507 [Persea americana]